MKHLSQFPPLPFLEKASFFCPSPHSFPPLQRNGRTGPLLFNGSFPAWPSPIGCGSNALSSSASSESLSETPFPQHTLKSLVFLSFLFFSVPAPKRRLCLLPLKPFFFFFFARDQATSLFRNEWLSPFPSWQRHADPSPSFPPIPFFRNDKILLISRSLRRSRSMFSQNSFFFWNLVFLRRSVLYPANSFQYRKEWPCILPTRNRSLRPFLISPMIFFFLGVALYLPFLYLLVVGHFG